MLDILKLFLNDTNYLIWKFIDTTIIDDIYRFIYTSNCIQEYENYIRNLYGRMKNTFIKWDSDENEEVFRGPLRNLLLSRFLKLGDVATKEEALTR